MKAKPIWATIKIALFSLLLILCAILLKGVDIYLSRDNAVNAELKCSPVIVIDPGHGGEDGGAVGINGCVEKELNLEIALILNNLLQTSGVDTVMTRCEDILLYDENIPGKKKSRDLCKRVEIANKQKDALTVSIHMNSYPISKYSGAQVYYSPNDMRSRHIAEILQGNITSLLQPDNKREIKESGSEIYLLHHTTNPCVLVECGFISNPREAELLCDGGYRRKMALVIYKSIIDYLNKEV